jgi:hypothetical protein
MRPFRSIAILLLPAWACVSAAAQPARQGARAAQRAQTQERQQAQKQARQQANQQARGAGAASELHPGDVALQRFLKMTPEERQNAIAQLPPQTQRQILQRLQQYQTMPPQAKERLFTQLELLHSLPPQRQNQVRRSLQQFQTLPEDRKSMIGQEMARLSAMPEEERRARMNSEEFRNIYSPSEQQMMGNMAEVLPPKD